MAGVLRLGQGEPIPGTPFIEKIRAADSGGRLSCQEARMRPRELVIPHVHSREDEFTLVIRVRTGARVGDAEYELGPGDLLFREVGALTERGEEVGPPQFMAIAARYGEGIKPEWIPDLVARFGVHL